jgi:hypothetical protein
MCLRSRICSYQGKMHHSTRFMSGNLGWPSGSFLAYWDITEALCLLSKGSISPSSDRDEDHGGVQENKTGQDKFQSLSKTGQSLGIKLKLCLWEFFWVAVGFKLRASGLLGRHCSLYHLSNSASLFCNGIFEVMSLEIFALAGLELPSPWSLPPQ